MNFRAFFLILGVFLSVLRICYVESPGGDTGPKIFSEDQNSSLNAAEANEVKLNYDLSDSSSPSSSSSSSSSISSSSSSYTTSSLSSSSSISLSTDTSTESTHSSSLEKGISSSELEQLVIPTVAPATPHFDTDSISSSSSSSVIASVTESIHQEKKFIEDDKPQNEFIMSSGINSEKKEISVDNKAKGKEAEKQEVKNVDEKPSKEEIIPEKPQEDQSEVISIPTAEAQKENKDDAVSPISVLIDKQEESKEDVKDKNDETETKEDESKDKEFDSITAGLKQAEEETKPTSEEMPSFDEFKRQHLQEEEEKQKYILKKQQEVKDGPETLSKTKTRKVKQRKQNNYASLDCGAKILKANPEASNIFSILQDNRDLYMLNPCSAKIWFIVELCDNVQVKTIEIANFELFSSTPESFKVYVSGRYPTREWTLLGTFQARDERNLQSFPLDEPIYAKYIKVEMLSHFGSEHYCPLSLFRVFGTSMMEELEDHEADGQDDGDAVDHDDDVAQVLPPNPSVKADDKETKSTANILATVGDTLFNIVKVAAKKLTGVIDSEKNLTSDSLGLSTVAPSSGIVSSTTANGQDAKPSIVTLIPSEDDDDDKLHDSKQENVTSNVTGTNTTETKKPDKQENKQDNTTFYEKIDSDGGRSSRTTSAFTSCELLVRMLGHSSFGCLMGKVLYSKRKYRGFTPREESPTRQKTSARNVKLPPGSDSTPDTSAEKGKEDSKKNEEKKEGEKEREKMEQKGKKNGKEKIDNENDEAIVKKERNENEIISKGIKEVKKKDSLLETTSSSDVKSGQDSKENVQTSFNGAIDPASIVQPSEVEPPIKKPSDPRSEEKGTPVLTTVFVLTTHPSSQNTDSQSTQPTNLDIQSTANPSEKSKDGLSVSDSRTTKGDASRTKPEIQDETGVSKNTKQDEADLKTESVESVVTKNESTVAEAGSSTVSGEESSTSSRDTCASADSLDKSLIKPSQSSSPSECKAPTIVAHPKDVDVLEFKMLDSAGREGTAHLEKPDKPVKPDQPADGKEPFKESKEQEIKEPDSTSQSDTGPSLTQEASDVISVSQKDKPSVSASSSSSSVEQLKPSVVEHSPPSEPTIPAQPTHHPDVSPHELPESISPLQPPPVDKAPVVPPSSSIESSITDDLSSVLSKAPSSAGIGGQGLVGSGAQKESIFMRLTNRIKALEQNLTLSTMYMEKLNQKYRKMVEEMQKNFDKKVNLLTNATIKAESVIRSQKEQILNLQAKIDETSRDMKQFNKKIANLNIQVMERHIIGLFLEVILIMILFIVFRRWDRARIRRDIVRESRMNGTAMTSHPYSSHDDDQVLGKILNGQLSAREQLQRSFANPCEPEDIGTFSESVAHRHKEEFFPPLDSKKKRNRKRPKSGIITTESSQAKSVSEPTNQISPSSLVSVTAGLLFSPARGLLNGFTRSQSLDDSQLKRKSSVPSTTTLSKTKSLNVIHEDSEKISFSTANTKKGRIPTPPPPPSPQKYWTAGSMDGLHQKRLPGQQLSSLKMTQKKGRGINETNPYA